MKKSLLLSLLFSLLAQFALASSQTYVLQKGWNSIGVFMELNDASKKTLLSYQPYELNESGYRRAEEIIAGRAYWINWSDASKTLVLYGDAVDKSSSSTAGVTADYRLTEAQSVAVGGAVTCTAPEVKGYTFTEWSASGVTLSSKTAKTVTFTMPANSVNLTPNYRKNSSGSGTTSVGSCALRSYTYSLQQGWNIIGISLDPTEASAKELFSSQLYNYKRQGNGGILCLADEIMAGKAYWIYRSEASELCVEGYAVENFIPGGDDAGLSDAARLTETLPVAKGSTVTRTAPSVKGYAFTKWTYSGISIADDTANPLVFTMPANPVKLTPNYRKLSSYTLTVNGKTYQRLECDPITFTAEDKTGYVFTGWTVSGVTLKDTSAKTVSFEMPANDVTLKANYTNKFTLTVDGKSSQKTYGDKVSETAPAKTGYTFDHWTVEGVSVSNTSANPITFTMPANDVTLTSHYTIAKYTLTVNGTSSQVPYGTTVTETAPEKTGCYFTNWTVSGVTVKDKTAETISFTMPANDVTLTANYSIAKYNLTVDGESSQKTYNDKVSVTAPTKSGCTFDHWTVKGVSVSNTSANPITFTMPGNDVTLTSNYTTTKYTLTVNSTSSQVPYGTTVTETAPEKTGCYFTNWTVSGVTVSDKTANPISFTMPANNVTLTANYEKIHGINKIITDGSNVTGTEGDDVIECHKYIRNTICDIDLLGGDDQFTISKGGQIENLDSLDFGNGNDVLLIDGTSSYSWLDVNNIKFGAGTDKLILKGKSDIHIYEYIDVENLESLEMTGTDTKIQFEYIPSQWLAMKKKFPTYEDKIIYEINNEASLTASDGVDIIKCNEYIGGTISYIKLLGGNDKFVINEEGQIEHLVYLDLGAGNDVLEIDGTEDEAWIDVDEITFGAGTDKLILKGESDIHIYEYMDVASLESLEMSGKAKIVFESNRSVYEALKKKFPQYASRIEYDDD